MSKEDSNDAIREVLSGFVADQSAAAKDLQHRQRDREVGEEGKKFSCIMLVDPKKRDVTPTTVWLQPLVDWLAGCPSQFSSRPLSRDEAETQLASIQTIRNPGPMDESPRDASRRFLGFFERGATFFLIQPSGSENSGLWMQPQRVTLRSAIVALDKHRIGFLGEGESGRPNLRERYPLREDTDESLESLEDAFHDNCRAHELVFSARIYGFSSGTQFDAVTIADSLVETEGFAALQYGWKPISRELAEGVVTQLLWKDMIHDEEEMPREEARALAKRFCDAVGEGATFLTNGTWSPAGREDLRSSELVSLIETTFDSGVVAVGKNRTMIFWVGWED